MQSPSSLFRSQRPTTGFDPTQRTFMAPDSSADLTVASQSQPPVPRPSSRMRTQSSRSLVPEKQISQIEKSVTHLLVATKQLLETLTQWSRKYATENEVSDVYVRLGYEFNLACRAFNAIGVETSDLGNVPDLLRTILEDTLSQDASVQSLDRYLPRIRDIIMNLLHGLKKKQARLRSRQQKDEDRVPSGRQASAGSTASGYTAVNQVYEETASTMILPRHTGRRHGSNESAEDVDSVPRSSSAYAQVDSQGTSYSEREASRRETQHILSQPFTSITNEGAPKAASTLPSFSPGYPAYPAPPPTPKQDDALGALQRSAELERRASRRFSAYQIQKHLGASSNGVPVLPSQSSPAPSRGGDVRESLNAVRLRGPLPHGKQRIANRAQEYSNTRGSRTHPSNVPDVAGKGPSFLSKHPVESPADMSAEAKMLRAQINQTLEGNKTDSPSGRQYELSLSPQQTSLAEAFISGKDTAAEQQDIPETPRGGREKATVASSPSRSVQFSPEQPSPGKELTLFLQYKSKIKKYVLPGGYAALSLGRLQLAFIEKFAWNTHSNGADLPEIYVQDPISGVRHELEDLNDVKDRSVLALNVDTLDEVKKHFDDSFGNVCQLIESVKSSLDGQKSAMQRVADHQLEAAREVAARLAVAVSTPASDTVAEGSAHKNLIRGRNNQLAELRNLRRDLAVLRQTYSNFSSDISTSMSVIRAKADAMKNAGEVASIQPYEGDAGRARVASGKRELSDLSERLVASVDDLQDLIEDLRKDVVSRGVRPLPRQLENVSKDISTVTKEIRKMEDFLKREKPIWSKIWEKELQLVCEERDQLTMQEDLAADLQDDLEKAAQTFALVEQATKQQAMESDTLRNTPRNVVIDPAIDPVKAKDGVLGEVRALRPNHESRLEAIDKAEKARKRDLESRSIGRFQRELGAFVQKGKLKRSGGVEEIERIRQAKDDLARKEVWERQQARAAEAAKAEEEAALASTDPGQTVEPPREALGGSEALGERERIVGERDENTGFSQDAEASGSTDKEKRSGEEELAEDVEMTEVTGD